VTLAANDADIRSWLSEVIEDHNSSKESVEPLHTTTNPLDTDTVADTTASSQKKVDRNSLGDPPKIAKVSAHKALALGFDVEWKPSVYKGSTSKVSVIQMSASKSALILQTNVLLNSKKSLNSLQTLQNILSSTRILKVGVGIVDDLKKLHFDYGMCVCVSVGGCVCKCGCG
jgi:3'-5' exonuclease